MALISKSRFVLGVSVFFLGFASPLFIPVVLSTSWSSGLKSTISGLLALGVPEIMMILAVAILGKEGYDYLKDNLLGFLHKISPDEVSIARYRFGLVLFTTPLIAGWGLPYLALFFKPFGNGVLWMYLVGDVIFISSFLVLGGDFWDKFRALFVHGTIVSK
ncbi:MAG: hypothetical protein O6848_02065, partial [Bacteroidetes bacterium]|nr:hypothetical protein [Bacteroidota bacterium]